VVSKVDSNGSATTSEGIRRDIAVMDTWVKFNTFLN